MELAKQQKSYAIRCSTEEQARECIESIRKELDEPKETLDIHLSRFYIDKRLPIILCKSGNNIVCNVGENMNKRPEDNGYTIITYEEAQSLGLLGEKKVCKSCLGKKQNSVYKGDKVLQPDFIGDGRYLLEGEGITMVDCSRCKGTGLEPEYIPELSGNSSELVEPQQNEVQDYPYHKDEHGDIIIPSRDNEVQESPSEDNLVEKIDSIMEEADRLSNVGAMDYWINIPRNRLREILNKHLLSK